MPTHDATYLSLADASQQGYGAYSTLRKHISDGTLPAVQIGTRLKVRRVDLDALLVVPIAASFDAIESAAERLVAAAPPPDRRSASALERHLWRCVMCASTGATPGTRPLDSGPLRGHANLRGGSRISRIAGVRATGHDVRAAVGAGARHRGPRVPERVPASKADVAKEYGLPGTRVLGYDLPQTSLNSDRPLHPVVLFTGEGDQRRTQYPVARESLRACTTGCRTSAQHEYGQPIWMGSR